MSIFSRYQIIFAAKLSAGRCFLKNFDSNYIYFVCFIFRGFVIRFFGYTLRLCLRVSRRDTMA